MARLPKITSLLKAALKRKQAAQPSYSLRALARDLGVSAPFLSKMMAGEKLPPKDRLERLCHLLELDIQEKELLVKAVMLDSYGEKVLGNQKATSKKRAPRKTAEAPTKSILSSWVNLALLEGLTLAPPHNEMPSLQKRLGISATEMNRGLATLAECGLIEKDGHAWKKKDTHLYVAGGRSRAEVRAFHAMMMAKARDEMEKQTSDEDYQRRLINGFTLALNPQHAERLKSMILDFLDSLSLEASEGECSEVYQCNLQFFPLTKKSLK